MAARGRINPFGNSAKPSALYPSLSHKRGLHRIVRGLESNCGLILVTGEIGIGKTSLSRHVQTYLADRFSFVELGNPYQTPLEQLYSCCRKFGLDTSGLASIHDCVGLLETHFHETLRTGKRPVLIFDEAHLLTKRHLSLIHILSNLRSEDGPLVQILLVGQLELFDLLGTEGMEALNQRIGVRYSLAPLEPQEVRRYIEFKLDKAGKSGSVVFPRKPARLIGNCSRGVPRLINHICAYIYDGLAFKGTGTVTSAMVQEVCADPAYSGMFKARSGPAKPRRRPVPWAMAGGAAAIVLAGVAFVLYPSGPVRHPATDPSVMVGEVSPPVPAVKAVSEVAPEEPAREEGGKLWVYEPSRQDAGAGIEPAGGELEEPVIVVGDPPSARSGATGPARAAVQGDQLDGDAHPLIGNMVIGALAWNEVPAKSVVVIDSQLVHEGEAIGQARLLTIGEDYIILELQGVKYKRNLSRQDTGT
jgi:type II secretory pathway predicted ATPase ExeA